MRTSLQLQVNGTNMCLIGDYPSSSISISCPLKYGMLSNPLPIFNLRCLLSLNKHYQIILQFLDGIIYHNSMFQKSLIGIHMY